MNQLAELDADMLVREAERNYLEAALLLTNLEPRMQRAVRLVLLGDKNGDKLSAAAAARRVCRPRQNVSRAVKLAKEKLDLVKRGE